MKALRLAVVCALVLELAESYYDYGNMSVLEPAARQLYDFRKQHPIPIGLLTTSSGVPVDLRQMYAINSNPLANEFNLDLMTHFTADKLPERIVHSKAIGTYGHFVVTNDVSKYIKSDVFNGIGKKTPVLVRFSIGSQGVTGTDFDRIFPRGLVVRFYTEEGNLDFLALSSPIFALKDPIGFKPLLQATGKKNPKTNLYDNNMLWDAITARPDFLYTLMWMNSDYGVPRGYRKMDAFPIHTYEIHNKHGDRYYVRFNFRSEQGLDFFTTEESRIIAGIDPDYYTRDLYNAIEKKDYPSWKMEMDVMSLDEVKNQKYDPFDMVRLWKNGTYHTVPIGRLVMTKNVENQFKEVEHAALSPSNLVPGINGVDAIFETRRLAYKTTQVHRLGSNYNRIEVNCPKYQKTYNRDGKPPIGDNMKDAPNYFPNYFNGPKPYVDESRPTDRLTVYNSAAIDLEPNSDFYNHILTNDAQRQRLADNLAWTLRDVYPELVKRSFRLLKFVDGDLAERVAEALPAARKAAGALMTSVVTPTFGNRLARVYGV